MSLFMKLATLIVILDIFMMAGTYVISPEEGIPESVGRVSSWFMTEEGMNISREDSINAMSGTGASSTSLVTIIMDTVGSVISSLGDIVDMIVFFLGAPYFFATEMEFPWPANILFAAVLYVPLFFSFVFVLIGRSPP